jgi:hypothetical protein
MFYETDASGERTGEPRGGTGCMVSQGVGPQERGLVSQGVALGAW